MDPQQCMREGEGYSGYFAATGDLCVCRKGVGIHACTLTPDQQTNIFASRSFQVFSSSQNNDFPNDDDHPTWILTYRMSGCG